VNRAWPLSVFVERLPVISEHQAVPRLRKWAEHGTVPGIVRDREAVSRVRPELQRPRCLERSVRRAAVERRAEFALRIVGREIQLDRADFDRRVGMRSYLVPAG
jgi:hypothetical protein